MEIIITDIQALALVACLIISYVAYRTRLPALSIVPTVALFIISFQLYTASEDPLIMLILWTCAVVAFIIPYRGSRA